MSDHPQMPSESASVSNWIWAVVAAIVAAVLTRWLGQGAVGSALLMGVVVFVVYAVLLAQFWEPPYSDAGDHDHDHGHDHGHGHADHGHDDHAHAAPAASKFAPAAAPIPATGPSVAQASATANPTAAAPVASAAPVDAVPAAAPIASSAPVVTPQASAGSEVAKPQALSGPRGGKPDLLQEIEGIGPVLEKLCHDLGIYHYDQIAAWGAGEIAWMDANLKGFKGRVTRDKWVAQARLIGAEGLAAFRLRAKSNDY